MSFSARKTLCGVVSALTIAAVSACSESPNSSCLEHSFAVPYRSSIERLAFEEIYVDQSFVRVYYHDAKKNIHELRFFGSGNGERVYPWVPLPILEGTHPFLGLDHYHGSAVVIFDDLAEGQERYANILRYTLDACFVRAWGEDDRLVPLTYVEIHLPQGEKLSSGSYQGKKNTEQKRE
ncbi:hypothetical protein HYT55_03585 [Candidatus Woesearchaeota archaeon]|nr:hypothetical protein [Candidatus Woesearchaeota archaeon]